MTDASWKSNVFKLSLANTRHMGKCPPPLRSTTTSHNSDQPALGLLYSQMQLGTTRMRLCRQVRHQPLTSCPLRQIPTTRHKASSHWLGSLAPPTPNNGGPAKSVEEVNLIHYPSLSPLSLSLSPPPPSLLGWLTSYWKALRAKAPSAHSKPMGISLFSLLSYTHIHS